MSWYLIPPLSEEAAKKPIGHHGRILAKLVAEVVELAPENDRGSSGTAWVYRTEKRNLAKELFEGRDKGILFARRNGAGFGVTCSVSGNMLTQAAKFSVIGSVLAVKRFKPNTPYRIGSISNAVSMAAGASRPTATIQVIAMSKQQYSQRGDKVFFVNSDRIAFNMLINGLVDAGIINTGMIKHKRQRGSGGGMINLDDDFDFEGGLAD